MKKLTAILFILLFSVNVSFASDEGIPLRMPWDDQVALLATVTPSYTVPPAADSCTGNLLYSHHAENNDDATTSANGVAGCSASTTYKSWALTSATYDNTAGDFYDGAYSLKLNGYQHYATITTTGWMDLTSKGSISMWFKANGANDCYVFHIYIDTTHFIYGKYNTATSKISLYLDDGSTQTGVVSDDLVDAGGSLIYFGWDVSKSAGTDEVRVKIGAGSWKAVTNLSYVGIGTMPTGLIIGRGVGASAYGYIDAVKIYTSADCT